MKCLHAARMARFDLFRAAQGPARNLARWPRRCDEQLCQLTCYVHTTKSKNMVGWVGNDLSRLEARLHADASFAEPGDP
jgi:hypothetical protein